MVPARERDRRDYGAGGLAGRVPVLPGVYPERPGAKSFVPGQSTHSKSRKAKMDFRVKMKYTQGVQGAALDQEQEIRALKAQMDAMRSEIEALKLAARRANTLVDAVMEESLSLAVDVTDAHEKVNCLLYQNPEICRDVVRLEEILGPADHPTPNAPPHS